MESHINIDFGNYLAFRRKLKKISQQYIANRLGLRREVIRDRELGINLQLDFIQNVAINIYGERLEEFLRKYFLYRKRFEEVKDGNNSIV